MDETCRRLSSVVDFQETQNNSLRTSHRIYAGIYTVINYWYVKFQPDIPKI